MISHAKLLQASLIVCVVGCGAPVVDDTPENDVTVPARFAGLVADGRLVDAAALVELPSRFYPSDDGLWVIASPGNSSDPEWTVAATPNTWATRFRNGTLRPTTLFGPDESSDRDHFYLSTGIMCDPLQAVVRIVPLGDRVRLFVDPIGERTDFVLGIGCGNSGNHELHGRTGVVFYGLLANRSPVPREFYRYPIEVSANSIET
ncbi:hypothetical protein [Rhodopirellula halodulae]|uniref:hypothetical protein n=1 Tax=Rhodopirellula halodulae TaxID=2894198 RepID=UPI001E629DF6|nr:hypothetical protein [Rhodopirellula sp. JC737]MCC9656750.1 hypothetical protein [Rhodopirellula sp. JC737]